MRLRTKLLKVKCYSSTILQSKLKFVFFCKVEPEIDKTFEMRPWRKNIKRSPSKEKSNESVADVNETTTNVESGNNKPWRQNMKKSTSTEGEKKPSKLK